MTYVNINGEEVPFGANILFKTDACEDFVLAVEICEDLWTAMPPSVNHALAGATIIANISASNEVIAKDEYREMLVKVSLQNFTAVIFIPMRDTANQRLTLYSQVII